jgi:tetratricopeptide (TPR) repeat protein
MNKAVTLFLLLLVSGTVFGQTTVDYLIKARALRERGMAEQAIRLLTAGIAETNDCRLFLERAESQIIKGDYSGAISDYNEADKLIPFSGEYGLSRIYALKGDAATSVYHLGFNLNSSFRKSEKDVMLDPAFGTIENSSEWRQFWKKDWYSPLEKALAEMEYKISSGKADDSKSLLSEIKKNFDSNIDVLYSEALVDLRSGRNGDAIKIINGIVLSSPDNEKYLRLLADAQTESSNPSGASVTYSHLIDLGVADAGLYLKRAECYRKTGENDKAISDIEKYLGYYPESIQAISLAGKVESASGDNLKALEYFSRNLKLHPDDAGCYIDRANSYFISKSWSMAISDYSMSLDLNPGNPDAWINKGLSLLYSGKNDDACHDFRTAFSLGSKRATEYVSKYCIK